MAESAGSQTTIRTLILSATVSAAVSVVTSYFWCSSSFSPRSQAATEDWPKADVVADGPTGAEYELSHFGLKHFIWDKIPLPRAICHGHLCSGFQASDDSGHHFFGYSWRDSFNGIEQTFCSPDGGWPGDMQGECPIGVPVGEWRRHLIEARTNHE